MAETSQGIDTPKSTLTTTLQWITIALLVYLLISSVGMIGAGFKGATKGQASELFQFATNPFTGLIIGILATAMIQSSSTVTSIIVGLVAGGLPVETAVPMIMGANIGTTITNTIVSLGHVRRKKEFRRAFASATVHDFFNVMAVVIFLPIEIMFKPLSTVGGYFAEMLVGGENMSVKGLNFIKPATKPVIELFTNISNAISENIAFYLLIAFGIMIIFLAITVIGKLLKKLMVGRAKIIMHNAIGKGPVTGIFSGAIITVLVQSSSTTTSLMVPLAGSGVFRLKQIYPFTLGANIGTTITALLAATAISGETAVFALQIALVHLFYNSSAVLLIYGIKNLRKIPIRGALWLARVATENKMIALGYILGVFFALPAALIFITN
ncbi:Na/Pi symporter [Pseudemcibacter aquimaris]|uniref:Na/Pi symporter n=1 Tax=Pseudemcibacter aquimaris TaxID=2857064 RepID=UPI00201281B1|nr:Na/Pi symporter [Pseudemcibacter aquimaris]MCC3862300.1 Na/Pi symporter [Pseudemcibacter aquimaris]WDU59048.1 Na/Pi symporter [Pseudemcibacter aquimaris]